MEIYTDCFYSTIISAPSYYKRRSHGNITSKDSGVAILVVLSVRPYHLQQNLFFTGKGGDVFAFFYIFEAKKSK